MIRILLVDDDSLITRTLRRSLEKDIQLQVIAVASNGEEAFKICTNQNVDVVLMDINMPVMNGILATKRIKKRYPHVKILMLTTFHDKENINQAIVNGADGYLLKTDKLAEIAPKIKAIASGMSVLSTDALLALTSPVDERLERLTPRELEIAKLVAQGMKNQEIADALFLAIGTVKNSLVIIMEKLEVTNRTQIAKLF